jgi:hypothetical protein
MDKKPHTDPYLLRSGEPGDDATRGTVLSMHHVCDLTAARVDWGDGGPASLVNVKALTVNNGVKRGR